MLGEDHQHAGQGPVLLDIGGNIGALILTMPAALQGAEIEIRPLGSTDSEQLRHVGVVARSAGGRQIHAAVFPDVPEGCYQLYERPVGPIRLQVAINGGQITEATWPGT